jgi:DNA-directed RNA polymerase subunit L
MRRSKCRFFVYLIISFQLFIARSVADNQIDNEYIFPVKYNRISTHKIDYGLLDDFLPQLILVTGPSEHKPAPRARKQTGSLASFPGNRKPSRLEGHRVLYSHLTQDNKNYLRSLKDYLENLPKGIPIETMTKSDQLAYWLNLHNITVALVIAEEYPISDVEGLYIGGEKCVLFLGCEAIEPLLNSTEVKIADETSTLGELRHHILMNWDNPLVLYGLYMGYIGSPNLRLSAYKGRDVWAQLEDNAEEFINSIRGTRMWSGTLRISVHYKLGEHLFPDFGNDIRSHLRRYGKRKVQNWLDRDPEVDPVIYNWGINDLHNGQPNNPIIFTEFKRRILRKLERQSRNYTPNVEIEEVID